MASLTRPMLGVGVDQLLEQQTSLLDVPDGHNETKYDPWHSRTYREVLATCIVNCSSNGHIIEEIPYPTSLALLTEVMLCRSVR